MRGAAWRKKGANELPPLYGPFIKPAESLVSVNNIIVNIQICMCCRAETFALSPLLAADGSSSQTSLKVDAQPSALCVIAF